jgi:hypothetical protein
MIGGFVTRGTTITPPKPGGVSCFVGFTMGGKGVIC